MRAMTQCRENLFRCTRVLKVGGVMLATIPFHRKRRALFLDRDSAINVDHTCVHKKEDFRFIDGVFELVAAANRTDYLVVVATNQAGIGRGYYSEADFHSLMAWVKAQFAARNERIDAVYFCPFHPEHGVVVYRKDSECRKPAPGMLLQAGTDLGIEFARSVLVGDKPSDMEAGRAAGVGALLHLGGESGVGLGIPIQSLAEAALPVKDQGFEYLIGGECNGAARYEMTPKWFRISIKNWRHKR